eukprot:1161230-Pelagomonas_calceolata.AAC.8
MTCETLPALPAQAVGWPELHMARETRTEGSLLGAENAGYSMQETFSWKTRIEGSLLGAENAGSLMQETFSWKTRTEGELDAGWLTQDSQAISSEQTLAGCTVLDAGTAGYSLRESTD